MLALGIAGCGGSGTTTLSRAELVRRVELACREAGREVEKRTRASRGSSDQSSFVDAIVAAQTIVVDKIDNLDTSGAAKADFQAFKDGMQARLDAIERVAEADRADQARAIRAAQPALEASSRRAQVAARRLGIDGCV
jgi:predicted ATPase